MTVHEFTNDFYSDWLGEWLGEVGAPNLTVTWTANIAQESIYDDSDGPLGEAYHVESVQVTDLYYGEHGLMNLMDMHKDFKTEVEKACLRLTEWEIKRGMELEEGSEE